MTLLGFNSQLAIGEEGTYGTYAAGTRTLEFVTEGLTRAETRLESQAIRAIQFQPRYALGQRSVSGDLTLELGSVGQGVLLKHAFGAVATDAAGAPDVYVHTFTPGDLDGLGLSVQVDRDGVPFSYLGCKVASLNLACQVGQIAQMVLSLVGQDEVTDETAAAAAFPADLELLTFVGASLSLGGTELEVQSADLTMNNTLNGERWKWGSRVTREPLRNGFRDVTGTFEVNFEDLTLYNRYVDGELATLVMNFEGITEIDTGVVPSLEITALVRTDGSTPTVSGPGEIMQSVPFKAFPGDGGTDADAITAVLTTTDATP